MRLKRSCLPSSAERCIRGRHASTIASASSSETSPVGRQGSMRAAKQPSTFHMLPIPAIVRWSSRASPIGRVGSSSRSRRRKRSVSSSGASTSGPSRLRRWSKRVRESVISSSTGPLSWITVRSPRRSRSQARARRPPGAVDHTPGAAHAQVRVHRQTAVEADEEVLAVGIDRGDGASRQSLLPARAAEARMWRAHLIGHLARQDRPDPVRRVVDRVALGHVFEGTARAAGAQYAWTFGRLRRQWVRAFHCWASSTGSASSR